MEDWYHITDESAYIQIKAFPGSSKTEFANVRDGRLCVRIAAAPEGGKANACLCAYFAKILGCAKRDVTVIKGEKSRLKTAAIPAAYIEKLIKITG